MISTRRQGENRPAVGLFSPERYNRTVGLALLCPVTSRVKGYPFELADQVRSLDWRRRRAEFAAEAPAETTEEVRQKVLALLG